MSPTRLMGRSFDPVTALDLLQTHNVIVLACMPAGLISPHLHGKTLEPVLADVDLDEVLDELSISRARFDAERKATGSAAEALALIIEERVRAGSIGFGDLLIHYALPRPDGTFQHKFLGWPCANSAAACMLDHAGAFGPAKAAEEE